MGRVVSFVGEVVSDKMNKTIVVKTTRLVKHPKYKKYIRRSKKFMVHDENNKCRVGDIVKFRYTRPLSRHKRWVVMEIVKTSRIEGGELDDTKRK